MKWMDKEITSLGWWDEGDDRARYLSVMEAPHNIDFFSRERGRNILFLWNLEGQSEVRTCNIRLTEQAASTTAPGPPSLIAY